MKIKLILLYTINSHNLSRKSINVRKYFSEYIEIDKELKKQIFSVFNSHLLGLKNSGNYTLVQKRNNKLKLSETGKKIIEKRNVNRMLKSIVNNYYSPLVEGYEVWNETELKFYNLKRKINNFIRRE